MVLGLVLFAFVQLFEKFFTNLIIVHIFQHIFSILELFQNFLRISSSSFYIVV